MRVGMKDQKRKHNSPDLPTARLQDGARLQDPKSVDRKSEAFHHSGSELADHVIQFSWTVTQSLGVGGLDVLLRGA